MGRLGAVITICLWVLFFWDEAHMQSRKNLLDPIWINYIVRHCGSLQNLISLFRFPCLLNSNMKFKKQSLPKWTDGRTGGGYVQPIWQPSPPLPSTILHSSPCKAVISMENMVWCFNEVFLSAGKRVEAGKYTGQICLQAPCTCSHHASYDWNSIPALVSLIKVLHAYSDD